MNFFVSLRGLGEAFSTARLGKLEATIKRQVGARYARRKAWHDRWRNAVARDRALAAATRATTDEERRS